MRRLVALTYPGENWSLGQHRGRESFLAALDDRDLEIKIRENEPNDLPDAYVAATRFYAYQRASSRTKDSDTEGVSA